MLNDLMDQNCWANERLIDFCRTLTPEQLSSDAGGTFGRLDHTLRHVVLADGGYLFRLGVSITDENPWEREQSLEDLSVLVQKCREGWASYFAGEGVSEMVREFGGSRWATSTEVVIAQALHHGAHHRAEACVNLTLMGLEPPDLSSWGWGEATGRMRNLGPAEAPN